MTFSRSSHSNALPILRTNRLQLAALATIIVVSFLTYLPAVDNFFISDDFDLFAVIEAAQQSPRWFFESTPEFSRLMSFIYFSACYWLFGLNPQPYYLAGIGLHAIVSILVYFLVRELTGSTLGAWAAGLFFAAFERHQEAVMWISAANETILALNCLLFLLIWRRAAERRSTGYFVLAHFIFALALLSKEAAVVLVPMAALQLLLAGYPFRAVLRKTSVMLTMLAAFAFLWLDVASRNPFVTEGYYAFGWQSVSVYARSLLRLATQIIPFGAAWVIVQYRYGRRRMPGSLKNACIFLGVFLVLAIVPYSFLTYLNHIPSRHTYLPSIGLAGLVGIVFAALYERMSTEWSRRLCMFSLLVLVTGNSAYIWVKKDPQFGQRAAPTRQLIEILNARSPQQLPIRVCRFPLDPWVFSETVKRFTPFETNQVMLADNCDGTGGTMMKWNEATAQYSTNLGESPAD